MKATLLHFVLALSLSLISPLFGQSYNAGIGSGTAGYESVHVGTYAGSVSTGVYNSFLGKDAGYSNTTGGFNSFIGTATGYYNTTGSDNSFIGYRTGHRNTTGEYNCFLGNVAGYSNTTGSYNSFLGNYAGYYNNTGANNVLVGYYAGFSNKAGTNNTIVGSQAGSNNISHNNTFIGKGAGQYNTTGNVNTFIGSDAGVRNTDGYHNVFIGKSTAQNNTTGYANTFVGNSAGEINTTGTFNTALGFLAGPSFSNLTNATAIGHRARVGISNAIVLGSINGVNGATATTRVGIGISSPGYLLHVNGTVGKPGGGSWTAASDKRLKQNIKEFTDGLAVIEQIRPVSFRYNGKAGLPTEKEYVGVIAQEMQKIAPYMVGEFTYQDSTGAPEKYLDYDATALTYMLVNAAKEQQQQIQSLQQENQDLKQELAVLKELIIKHIPEAGNQQARLGQNNPNPYTQSTSIPYQFPVTAKNASIKVYSSTGKELKSFDLSGKTQGEVTLSGGLFPAGTYVYTLFVDGVQIDSKKLVITR